MLLAHNRKPKMGRVIVNCKYCGKEVSKTFSSFNRVKVVFCSVHCRAKGYGETRKKPDIQKTCKNCGNIFIKSGRDTSSKKEYCSHRCFLKSRIKKDFDRECVVCHKKYRAKPNGVKIAKDKTCGIKCYREYIKNKEKIRQPYEVLYKKQRKRVLENREKWYKILFERGLNKCSVCGYEKCKSAIELHHVNPSDKKYAVSQMFSQNPTADRIREVDKCVAMCANCHREYHENNGRPVANSRKKANKLKQDAALSKL